MLRTLCLLSCPVARLAGLRVRESAPGCGGCLCPPLRRSVPLWALWMALGASCRRGCISAPPDRLRASCRILCPSAVPLVGEGVGSGCRWLCLCSSDPLGLCSASGISVYTCSLSLFILTSCQHSPAAAPPPSTTILSVIMRKPLIFPTFAFTVASLGDE